MELARNLLKFSIMTGTVGTHVSSAWAPSQPSLMGRGGRSPSRAIMALRAWGATLSGFSAAALGYGGHFLACVILNLLVVGVVARWLVHPTPLMQRATEPG